eukprot:m.121037 g.121037  ORF g.121037 m.121037 type:complete len:318 (-) comp17260_c0_seq4:71-1024(-)
MRQTSAVAWTQTPRVFLVSRTPCSVARTLRSVVVIPFSADSVLPCGFGPVCFRRNAQVCFDLRKQTHHAGVHDCLCASVRAALQTTHYTAPIDPKRLHFDPALRQTPARDVGSDWRPPLHVRCVLHFDPALCHVAAAHSHPAKHRVPEIPLARYFDPVPYLQHVCYCYLALNGLCVHPSCNDRWQLPVLQEERNLNPFLCLRDGLRSHPVVLPGAQYVHYRAPTWYVCWSMGRALCPWGPCHFHAPGTFRLSVRHPATPHLEPGARRHDLHPQSSPQWAQKTGCLQTCVANETSSVRLAWWCWAAWAASVYVRARRR